MSRNLDKESLSRRLLALLTAAPEGLASPVLQRVMDVSQPTVSRLLVDLRARGLVVAEGNARARRYHAVQGKADLAALRSRKLHEQVAQKLIRHPDNLQRARKRLKYLKSVNPAGKPYHDRWESLLREPLPKLLRKMTEDSEEATLLRKESPFTVLLTPAERRHVFDQFAAGKRQ